MKAWATLLWSLTNDIRSPNAAFDPEYTGKNIMGNATVPMLGATAELPPSSPLKSDRREGQRFLDRRYVAPGMPLDHWTSFAV